MLNEFCSINWLTFLEYLKVFISWPVAVVIVVLLLIVHFKKNIAALIDRIEKANFPGGSISTPVLDAQRQVLETPPSAETPLQQAAEAAPATPPQNAGAAQPNTEIAPEFAELIPDIPQLINYVLANPGPTVTEYGRTIFALNSERSFNTIFGTQIAILEQLATTGQSMTRQEISPFHQKHQQLAGNAEYTLDQYLAYMVNTALLEIDPTNQEAYRSTVFGLRFLNYIKTTYPNRWNTVFG